MQRHFVNLPTAFRSNDNKVVPSNARLIIFTITKQLALLLWCLLIPICYWSNAMVPPEEGESWLQTEYLGPLVPS